MHVFFSLFYDSKNQKLYFFYWHRTISANINIWMCFIDTVTSLLFTIKIWEITCSCSHSKHVFLCRINNPLFSCVSHVVLWASPRCKTENLTCSGLVVGNQCRHLFTSEKKKKREKKPHSICRRATTWKEFLPWCSNSHWNQWQQLTVWC